MNKREYFFIDEVRCHYCARCQPHDLKQHEEHLSRWCEVHRRWCGDHNTAPKTERVRVSGTR